MLRRVMSGILAVISAVSCSSERASEAATHADALVWFAASSTTEAAEELAAKFTGATGIRVRVNAAGSGYLEEQAEYGAECDVFLASDTVLVGRLAEKGLVEAHRELLRNRLAVIVPADSSVEMDRLNDLTRRRFRTVALATPSEAPVGVYARRALRNTYAWEDVRYKGIFAGDAREAMFLVERGEADAAIVYVTDAAHSDRVRVAYEIETRHSGPIVYGLALLRSKDPKSGARQLYEYVASAEALDVFRRHGFEVIESD